MMLTELADVLRRAGLPAQEVAGWQTRGHGPMSSVSCVVLHHTAGPATGEAPSLATVTTGRPGLAGPLAQLVLGRSGTWYVVAAGLSYHAGVVFEPWQGNAHAIGIEAEATGVDAWPPAQYASYVAGARALADYYGVPYSRVLGHREVAAPAGRKVDPNLDLAAFRAALSNVEDDVTAAEVWTAPIRNAFGDTVQAAQILVGTEHRVADVQRGLALVSESVGDLAQRIDGLSAGGVDLDALAAKVADLLAQRLAA
ncbi:MAG: N-acetylmuramoyl-L-alanine amidase [Pseudonocardia sp.]|nr:N-acetylmuramoyl-L-alanine amidase [Pseudonocardia sp.]